MSSASHDNPGKALVGALAFAVRAAGWALAALTVADIFVSGPVRTALLPLNNFVSGLVPAALAGAFLIQTPFGGAFRGDFALLALALLVLDWALCKAAAAFR